jgi:hypothetical protein
MACYVVMDCDRTTETDKEIRLDFQWQVQRAQEGTRNSVSLLG